MKDQVLSQAEIDALFAAASGGNPSEKPETPEPAAETPAPAPVAAAPVAAVPAPEVAPVPTPAPAVAPMPAAPAVQSAPPATTFVPAGETAAPAVFATLGGTSAGKAEPQIPITLLSDVELEVTVQLGQTRRSIREILEMSPGHVLELDRLAGDSVDILVNGRLVAKAEVVVIGDNFGVRITELIRPEGGTGA
ncbi:MAG: flagellar motor switch protein FliN [Mycobacterium leprae]